MTKKVRVAYIRTSEDLQPRKAMIDKLIGEYAEAMEEGARFPPVVVFDDKGTLWLADGFHRVAAARQIDLLEIEAEVVEGTKRDAMLYSVGSNATHGQRRSNADKRRAVLTLLEDDEWSKWSDSEIARRCSVDHKTVASIRSSLGNSQVKDDPERTYTTKHGTTATMRTENIGRQPVEPEPAEEEHDEPDVGNSDEQIDRAHIETKIEDLKRKEAALDEREMKLDEWENDLISLHQKLEKYEDMILGADAQRSSNTDRLFVRRQYTDVNQAIDWFSDRVWPLVQQAVGDIYPAFLAHIWQFMKAERNAEEANSQNKSKRRTA